MSTKRIAYIYPHLSTFIRRDIDMLGSKYEVKPFEFAVKKKWLVPWQFVRQFFFLVRYHRSINVYYCHFAGYASYLPALYARLFSKKCLIIVAGTDGAGFKEFRYGNFARKMLGWFTGKSLQMAHHVYPVHESLVYQAYDYFEDGKPAQGYTHFWPKAKKTPFTPLYYGYSFEFFKPDENIERVPNSFITIGNLNESYAFRRKGFDLIIELAKLRPELQFTLVGWDGVKQIDVPQNVRLLKFMSQPEVVKALCAHEYYFQLSIMEGFPNALAEAMLCGCIPIGSNVSGIPLIVGSNGYLLKHRDLNELNALIDEAMNDKRRESLPLSARNHIVSNFSTQRRLDGLVKGVEG